MYLALREIRFARGRFALMGSVVALITLLLVMLSGLTSGLARQNTSALEELPADLIVFGAVQDDPSYAESTVTAEQQEVWSGTDGVDRADALGISQAQIETGDAAADGAASVAVFGVGPDSSAAPADVPSGAPDDEEIVLSADVAEQLDADAGATVAVGAEQLTVAAVVPDQWYSHTPVVWTSLGSWQDIAARGDPDSFATVLAASGGSGAEIDADSADAAADTESMSPSASYSALPSYSSENGSLTMMQAMLYLISGLVIAAFLTVWTVQRTRDIAVLKALGASTRYVLRDALAQALLVLLAGAALGGAVGLVSGLLAREAAPFTLSALTTVAPAGGVVGVGLVAAALAVRRVTRVDPMLALGGS
ncbi:ABC transporter permease [Nesterenkonia sp. F]|uniref:ABC transporter permease n=1 Tax=Nesterenkonia sp. F TaxID=795955 RepID=UPI000255CB5C|nr:ABC transporter permease [Nesterenkonia sp. F]